MHVRCPQCHGPVEILGESSFTEINCPSCGSSFSLISGDSTALHQTEVRKLAHFDLVRELGIGKFGSVWMARDTKLDRTVAIKIPRKGALDAHETELFLRDARAAAQLKHPGIVGVHEIGRHDDTVYIVSDYVEGANLKDWLTGQRLSFRESAEMVVTIAEALHHAHEAGVVHRDLKPGNIMVDLEGQPHVIDFGLARREAGEITMTVEGHILGTPAYMPPEQAKGKGHQADRRSDVYSLGVILFELLTGELPFRGEAQMLIVQIQRDEPPRPRRLNNKIPHDLQTITLKCLEKDPAKRYQTAQALADDLNRWLKHEPIQARPIGRPARAWRWCKRNRAVATLGAIVLAALTLGTTFSTYFAIRAQREAIEAQIARDTAAERERTASSVSEYLIGMFEAPATIEVFGVRLGTAQDPVARALLERGGDRLTERLDDQPAIKARLTWAIGRAHMGTGNAAKGVQMLEQVLAYLRQQSAQDTVQMAQVLRELSTGYLMQGRIIEAETLAREQYSLVLKSASEESEDAAVAKTQLALILSIPGSANRAEAEKLYREALEIRRKTLDKNDPRIAEALIGIAGNSLWGRSSSEESIVRRAEALRMLSKAAAICNANDSVRGLGRAIVARTRAFLLTDNEAKMDAKKAAYEGVKESIGSSHPISLFFAAEYASGLMHFEQHDAALMIYEDIFATFSQSGISFLFPYIERKIVADYSSLLLERGESKRLNEVLTAIFHKQRQLTQFRSQNGAAVLEKLLELRSQLVNWKVSFTRWERVGPMKPPANWQAVLGSEPFYETTVPAIAFDWGDGGPRTGVTDHFATIATTTVDLTEGEYVFVTESDDGVRVLVDSQIVIENWDHHGAEIDQATIQLTKGKHAIRVEHFEIDGAATLRMRFAPLKIKD